MAKLFAVDDVLPQGLVKITGEFYSGGFEHEFYGITETEAFDGHFLTQDVDIWIGFDD